MPRKPQEKHDPDKYRLVARPAVKGKFIGAITKASDTEDTPLFTCGHKHDDTATAIACARRAMSGRHFDIVN